MRIIIIDQLNQNIVYRPIAWTGDAVDYVYLTGIAVIILYGCQNNHLTEWLDIHRGPQWNINIQHATNELYERKWRRDEFIILICISSFGSVRHEPKTVVMVHVFLMFFLLKRSPKFWNISLAFFIFRCGMCYMAIQLYNYLIIPFCTKLAIMLFEFITLLIKLQRSHTYIQTWLWL